MLKARSLGLSLLAALLLYSLVTIVERRPAIALAELPPGGTFTDDNEMFQEGWIEAIAAADITRGCNPPAKDRFCPDRTVTRGEMASFLARALQLPGAIQPDRFIDDDESVHRHAIEAIAEAGITRGCNPPVNDRFCPDAPITRGQMAAFMARAYEYPPPPDGTPEPFSDDNTSIFEADINKIAAQGITRGCGDSRYCPRQPMLRKNMAIFLGRAEGLTPNTPEPVPVVLGSFTTYYSAGQSRVKNIHLIANATDGAVVMPGKAYSLNATVGRRTTSKGYVRAGAIINGKLYCCDHWANIGGGTSQFATTLYNAIFFAGVVDVYHKPHSIYFSRYPMGREATLGWTGPDVKFRNDTEYPITVDTSHTSTSVTVKLIGNNGLRKVSAHRSGSASTSRGGAVTVARVIRFQDGTKKTERWSVRYNPAR